MAIPAGRTNDPAPTAPRLGAPRSPAYAACVAAGVVAVWLLPAGSLAESGEVAFPRGPSAMPDGPAWPATEAVSPGPLCRGSPVDQPATAGCPRCGAPPAVCPGCGYAAGGWWAGWRERLLPLAGARGSPLRPVRDEGWRHRPLSAGVGMGGVWGGDLIDDWLAEDGGFFGVYRLGWDWDDYWGGELRLSMGGVALADSDRAIAAHVARDGPHALNAHDRDLVFYQGDVSLLYYPWGDAPWRPYLVAGFGLAEIDLLDRLSQNFDDVVFALPLGLGVKYRATPWCVLRLEFADNMLFPDELAVIHHLALTGGLEYRFGGSRKAYWPWNPGRHYW